MSVAANQSRPGQTGSPGKARLPTRSGPPPPCPIVGCADPHCLRALALTPWAAVERARHARAVLIVTSEPIGGGGS